VPGQEPTGTTHGSPWSYDTRVPLLWFGSSIKRGAYREATSIADIAPTLSALLGFDAPVGSLDSVLR
jgi:arylsulfatase A-like enzyme